VATGRIRFDRDLDAVIYEPVGSMAIHLDASSLKSGKVEVFRDQAGNHHLSAGDGRTKVADGSIVRAADIPNTDVTSNDLTGKKREDTPVIGTTDRAGALTGQGEVPDAVLKKAAVGQTPNIGDDPNAPKDANLGAGAGQ
jgi:hypothetical protein